MTRRVTISVSAVDPALLRRQVGRLAEAEAALRWGYNPRATYLESAEERCELSRGRTWGG